MMAHCVQRYIAQTYCNTSADCGPSLQVNIGLRVLTRPVPGRLPEIYRTLGTDYGERVLPSIIQVLFRADTLTVLCTSPSPAHCTIDGYWHCVET